MITDTARRAAIATLVVGGIVVVALALWELKLLVSLLFLAFIIAAAMRPGIDALYRHRVPRAAGVGIHYLALAGLIALFLWAVVPRALSQVQAAAGNLPATSELHDAARGSTGLKHDILIGLERRLKDLFDGVGRR